MIAAAKTLCLYLVLLMLIASPVEYFAILNCLGPSTDYFDESVASARHIDGESYIQVGDDLVVKAEVIRHRINGTCRLAVWRVRQNVGGKFDGRISLLQYIEQNFVGDGQFRHTSWPIPPTRIVVTENWFDDPNVAEQTIDIFVIARYYCNFLDDLYPRWIDGIKKKTQTPASALHGFAIPYWNGRDETAHAKIIMKR